MAGAMKDKADYSKYKCPYEHLEKDIGHELHGPEGYEERYGIWCACGFNGPVFYLEPEELKLDLIDTITIEEAYEMGKPCPECQEHPDDGGHCIYPYYGVAPHKHGKKWETEVVPKSEWPKNFAEDPDSHGCGTYTHCLTCGAPNA